MTPLSPGEREKMMPDCGCPPGYKEATGCGNNDCPWGPRRPLKGLHHMTDYAWLIEAPGQRYLAMRELCNVHEFYWTADHNAALRFHSEKQADDAMMAIRALNRDLFGFAISLGVEARPVEHGWIAALHKEPSP